MGLLSKFFSNTRKPEGFFGRLMVNGMNSGGEISLNSMAWRFIKASRTSAN